MTDREKIAERLDMQCLAFGKLTRHERGLVLKVVERLIRDAAERAYWAGCDEGEEAALEHATSYSGRPPKLFPSDFPLVSPQEAEGCQR